MEAEAQTLTQCRKILVVGCPGSGKSTFSAALGEVLGLPVLHLDSFFWSPGWVEPDREMWRERIASLVTRDTWIMDGNYSGTWDIRLPAADAVVWLDASLSRSLINVFRRWRRYRGQSRPDMAPGCPEKVDADFLHFIIAWHLTRRRRVLSRIAGLRPDLQPIIVRGFSQSRALLDALAARRS